MHTHLYDTDFDTWAQQQAEVLRRKDWAALDIEHLAEEVEELRSDSWQATIVDARRLLADALEDSLSLARVREAGQRMPASRTREPSGKWAICTGTSTTMHAR